MGILNDLFNQGYLKKKQYLVEYTLNYNENYAGKAFITVYTTTEKIATWKPENILGKFYRKYFNLYKYNYSFSPQNLNLTKSQEIILKPRIKS